jgi:hypothetical protein
MRSATRPVPTIQAQRHDLLVAGLAQATAAGDEHAIHELWDGIADAATTHDNSDNEPPTSGQHITMGLLVFPERGPRIPHPHGGSGLGSTLTHSIVSGVGWRIGSEIVQMLPIGLVVVIGIVAVGWYVIRHRRGARR